MKSMEAFKSRLSKHLAYDSYGDHQEYQHTIREQAENQYSDTFLRKTLKFWVLPSNCLAVKTRILRHIPEWRFDGKVSPSLEQSGSYSTSIYFDTSNYSLYNKRILQYDGSMLFRYRWYGRKKCSMGFMEQKIRKEAWRGEASIKQRFQLDPNLVPHFFKSGKDVVPLKLPFIHQMHEDTLKWDGSLQHAIRTEYRRSVYQENNGAAVRISFDEDVELKDITALTFAQALDPSIPVAPNRVFRFPLGILEVKLAFDTFEQIDSLQLPKWIYAMMDAGFIIQIDKFSKYCTGVCVMNHAKILRVPSWIKAVKQLMEIELGQKRNDWLGVEPYQATTEEVWNEIRAAIKLPKRTEPREYLANERTLIKWVRMCFLCIFVGFALLGFQYEPVSGIILIVLSMLLLFRAYYVYLTRNRYFIQRTDEQAFEDKLGPPLLLVLFVVPALSYLAWSAGVFNVQF